MSSHLTGGGQDLVEEEREYVAALSNYFRNFSSPLLNDGQFIAVDDASILSRGPCSLGELWNLHDKLLQVSFVKQCRSLMFAQGRVICSTHNVACVRRRGRPWLGRRGSQFAWEPYSSR
jgi:hypothetical protein